MAISNFSGLNVSVGQGEGAANVLQWNNIDRAAAQIQANQRQREMQGQNEYLAAQLALQKELGNIRSADQQDAMQLYQKQKALKQELLFNPKVKRDPLLYNKLKNQADLATADFYAFTKASQELGNTFKKIPDVILNHPDRVLENAGQELRKDVQIPTVELMKNGWNEAKYLDTTPSYNLGSALQKATGSQQKYRANERFADDKKLQVLQDVYTGFNNPEQFHAILMNTLSDKKAGQAAALAYRSIPPEQVQAVNAAFDAIPEAEWKKWGLNKKPNIYQSPYDSYEQKYANYSAKLYAISNIPKNPDVETRNNLKNVIDYNDLKVRGRIALNNYNRKSNQETPPSIQFSQDLIDAFSKNDNEQVKNVLGRLFAGNTGFKLEPDGYRILDNGQLAVTFRPVGTDKYGDKFEAQQYIFDINDPDLSSKLVGLYQQFVGSETKGEGDTFTKPKPNPSSNPKPQPKPKGITLKGTETPDNLKVGQLYILDGVPVIWNGKNLVKQK